MPKGTHDAAVKLARVEKLATILAHLRDQGPTSVTVLAQATGLSRPTVTSILQELEQVGLVDGDDPLVFGGGRPATPYRFRATAGYALAVDLLQSSLAVSVCALDGKVVTTGAMRVPEAETAEDRFQFLLRSVDAFLEGAQVPRSAVLAASLSTTGTLDGDGTVQASYWVPIWQGFPLGERLRAEWPFPAGVENDVNSAAFGELTVRSAVKDLLYLRFNPRLTMGLVLGGRIHTGFAHRAGEMPGRIGGQLVGLEGPHESALAEAIALAAAVVDPGLVVLQSNRSDTDQVVDRVRRDLDALMPPSGGPVAVEAGRLGQAAALVGGLSLALEGAMSRILDGITVGPPVLQGLDGLRRALRAGGHTASLATEDDGVAAPMLSIGIVGSTAAELGLWVEQPANNARVVAAFDPTGAVEAEHGVGRRFPRVDSLQAMIRTGVEAVIVGARCATAPDIDALLAARIPVLLEQPPAASLSESVAIVRAAGQAEGLVVVANKVREGAAMRAFREVLEEGTIGELTGLWARRYTESVRDDAAFSGSAPDVDAIHWLADSPSQHVVALAGGRSGLGDFSALTSAPPRAGADHSHPKEGGPGRAEERPGGHRGDVAMLLMRLESGVIASYEESFTPSKERRHYVAIGSTGRAELVGDERLATLTVWADDDPSAAEPRRQAVFDSEAPGHQRAEERMVASFLRQVRSAAKHDGLDAARQALGAALEAQVSAVQSRTALHAPS